MDCEKLDVKNTFDNCHDPHGWFKCNFITLDLSDLRFKCFHYGCNKNLTFDEFFLHYANSNECRTSADCDSESSSDKSLSTTTPSDPGKDLEEYVKSRENDLNDLKEKVTAIISDEKKERDDLAKIEFCIQEKDEIIKNLQYILKKNKSERHELKQRK